MNDARATADGAMQRCQGGIGTAHSGDQNENARTFKYYVAKYR